MMGFASVNPIISPLTQWISLRSPILQTLLRPQIRRLSFRRTDPLARPIVARRIFRNK